MNFYDFVIVGGGLAGLSLACRLAGTAAGNQGKARKRGKGEFAPGAPRMVQ